MAEPDIKKGLAGVVVDTTSVSKVNPDTNSLLYRGYPVQELAAKCTFEEVAYLLWKGELPDAGQLEGFERLERSRRHLPHLAKEAIDLLPVDAHPMDVVRTAVSAIGAADPTAADSDPGGEPRQGGHPVRPTAGDRRLHPASASRTRSRRAARRPRLLGATSCT